MLRTERVAEATADFATRGLTAVHVLARDCSDASVLRSAVEKTGAEMLTATIRIVGGQLVGGGAFPNGKPACWVPMHLAGLGMSSPLTAYLMLLM